MTIYLLDKNNFYISNIEKEDVEHEELNYTIKQMTVGYVKPKFEFDLNDWVEGATPQEIEEWEEANKPLPPQPDEISILNKRTLDLSEQNVDLDFRLLTLEISSLA